jgi:hypothetical protein
MRSNSPSGANRTGFVITRSCTEVAAALRWWDYLSYPEEMPVLMMRGEEGILYTRNAEGTYVSANPTEEILRYYGYEEFANNIVSSTILASLGMVNAHPLVYQAILPDLANDTTSPVAVRFMMIQPFFPFMPREEYIPRITPADVDEEFMFRTEGLVDYINAFAANSIMNGVTDESWGAHIAELNRFNYDWYVQFYQRYLDGNW